MINIFSTPEKTVKSLARFIFELADKKPESDKIFTIALSGGNTPILLFEALKKDFNDKMRWENIHIFWGDERCVDPLSPESNYGVAKEKFIDVINIPHENIHRINGENEPVLEAERYSKEIGSWVNFKNGLPSFDLIILGLGEDGHTASIFPDQMGLLESNKICEIAVNPQTHQKRITITGKVINNAKNIVFLISGNKKADIVSKIINKKNNYIAFPASYIRPEFGNLIFYLDEESANNL